MAANKKTVSNPSKSKKVAPKKEPKKGTCFVMMPFGGWNDTYYREIYLPAVNAAGLTCERADDMFRPSPIVSDIWNWIQRVDVLLADMTGRNPNVFYELGLAHAIGKPVVLVSESIDDVPFDLQSYRVITFDKNSPDWSRKLKADITKFLQDTLADPVDAVPEIFRKIVPSQAPEQDEIHARLDILERFMSRVGSRTSTMTKERQKNQALNDVVYQIIHGTRPTAGTAISSTHGLRGLRAVDEILKQQMSVKKEGNKDE